ncbi:MAG: 50S ribosomal protein L25 [Chloroflexota bacterium]
MPQHPLLKAEPREVLGKKVRRLRREGLLPATVYGHNVTPQSIQLNAHELITMLRHTGRTQLIDLAIGSQAVRPVFIKQTAIDAKRHLILHVEFFQANLREKTTSHLPLHFDGESPAVKLGGIFLPVLDHIDIESLPDDIPADGWHVDISSLLEMNDQIHVSDLHLPDNVAVLTPDDEVVAKGNPPISEAEVEETIAETTPLPDELGGDQPRPDAVPES